jgi:hypothetical protein
VDGELESDIPGAAFREVILSHLAHCERCARLEGQLRVMRRRLRACGASEVPADERPRDEFRAKMARLLAG